MSEIINKKASRTKASKIGLKKLTIITFTILINIIIIMIAFYINDLSFQKWVFPFSILALLQLVINLITINKLEGIFFSLNSLFLIFSFITHLGIVLIFGFKIQIDLPWDPLLTISDITLKNACNYALSCHLFLTLGMSLILIKKKGFKDQVFKKHNNLNINNQLYLTRIIGSILILIGIIPMLYIDITKIKLFMAGNYLDTFRVGVPGFVSIMASFTEIGIMMVLIAIKDNKKLVTLIYSIVIFYQGVLMFTGGRGGPILYILTLTYIYFRFIKSKKMKIRQIIIYILVIYVVGFLLTFISQTRMLSINDIGMLLDLAKNSLIDFSPFSIIAEFGVTIITLGISMDFFSANGDYQYGANYILSLLNIFPNIGGVLDTTIPKTVYVYNWPSYLRTFLGGSYLGEIYYSFGRFGPFFVTFIGLVVGFLSVEIQRLFEKKLYVKLSILLILFPNILWWTRAYFVDMVREFVWTSVLITILYMFFNNRYKKLN